MRPGPDALSLYVIYDHPSDYPEWWVVTRQAASGQGVVLTGSRWLAHTLEAARGVIQRIAPGSVCLGREPDDDAVIHEVWI